MMNDKPAKPAADHLAKELKSSLAKERPRTWKPVLVLVVIFSLILAGLYLLIMPRGRPPVMQVVALDGLFTSDEQPVARAQLFAPPTDGSQPRLSGHSIVFDNKQGRSIIVKSDNNGQGAADWPMEKETVAGYFVR